MMKEKLLVLQIAALGYDFLTHIKSSNSFAGIEWYPMKSEFPAVTSVVQATLRTALHPSDHGIIANGFYSREFKRTFFWEQSSSLLEGERIWSGIQKNGKKVAQLCFQQSLGTDSDILVSPAPVHKHHGGMIQDCYTRPANFYSELKISLKRPFDLKHYWGPFSSIKSSQWIADAIGITIKKRQPDLLFAYIPHLDYSLQKYGPASLEAKAALNHLEKVLELVISNARESGYAVIAFGDYAIAPVNRVVYPNRVLKEHGLFSVRYVNGMTYPDLHLSRAFALADHQIAHVYIQDNKDIGYVKDILGAIPGINIILDENGMKEYSIHHRRSGELVMVTSPDSWFSYQWWNNKKEMPDYAPHVDIHSKPGYDPCELYTGSTPFTVSTDSNKIKGSHGICDKSTMTAISYSDLFDHLPDDIFEFATDLRKLIKS